MKVKSHALATINDNFQVLVPTDSSRDSRHRLSKFAGWLNTTGGGWAAPNLRRYRDYLLHEEGLSPESVAVHLSTIRTRYRELLLDRRLFFSLVPPQASFAEYKALVDELIARIQAAIDPRAASIRTRSRQDRADSERLRLTQAEVRTLLAAPDSSTLVGARDRAIIALLICTGIREAELCALQTQDLRQHLEGALALHVRAGKGQKERLIPYGELDWCLSYVDAWLRKASIHSGYVFRGLRKGDHVRETPLNERTIQKILARYPIEIQGKMRVVQPHDCRRTYARRLYDVGVKVDAIRQNMGHETIEMTFNYIGRPDVTDRLPPRVFQP